MGAPFFIVGSGRSGSTLLRVILCEHSQVTIPPETYFIKPLLERLPVGGVLDAAQVADATRIITSHYRWPDMDMSDREFLDAVGRLERPYLRDILDVIYDFHLEREGKSTWGDKTPPYVSVIPGLVSLYPDARIIHLVRDGRDVAKSFQSTGWYGVWLHDNTREWRDAIRSVADCRAKYPEIEIHEVRYEDLVMETENTIRSVCRYLGIGFEPGMLDWEDSLNGRIPDREAHIHRKLHRKPKPTDINRWKTEIPRRELLVAEAFMARELKAAGYALHFSSHLWMPVFVACRLLLPAYELVSRVPGFICRRIARVVS